MLVKIDTVWVFIKILSIPDEEWFSEMAVGCTATYFIKIFKDISVGFVTPPSFEAVYSLFAVAEGWLLLDIRWFVLFFQWKTKGYPIKISENLYH